MATSVDEFCKGDVVRLVEVFVQVCPSLLINATTLQEAFAKVNAVKQCLRPGNTKHQSRLCALVVKMVLSKWRDLCVYPDRYARAMLQAGKEQRHTISRLKRSIQPFNVITSALSDLSTTTGGTDPSKSSDSPPPQVLRFTTIKATSTMTVSVQHYSTAVSRSPTVL